MNTTQLSCFVEVAGELSFSKAAEKLHLSQPTVSHQVRALEDELGCTLLARSTRTVQLTDEGRAFLGYALEILDLEARAQARLTRGEGGDAPRLRVGVGSGLEAQLLVPTLRRLHELEADFEPVLQLGPYSVIDDMLENGTADVVLAYRDPAGEHAGATTFHRLLDAGVACVCAADHPLARSAGGGVTGEELTRAGRVAVANPHAAPAAITQAQRAVGLRMNERQVMVCANIEVALALARAGIAFTLMPDVPALHQPDLRFVPVLGAEPIAMGVRVRRGRRRALLDRFIEVLGEELARDPCA